VCDLVETIGVPQPKISRHLAYLRKVGLVVARKEGLWQYYRLAPAKNSFHEKLLDCLSLCFKAVSELKQDAVSLRSKKCSGSGRCC
jgi:ArsR family transcriptional regulator